MFGINQAQVASVVRWGLATGGALFVQRGWVSSDQVSLIGGIVTAVLPLFWSIFFTHTTAGQLNAAAAIPGAVEKVSQIVTNQKIAH